MLLYSYIAPNFDRMEDVIIADEKRGLGFMYVYKWRRYR